jgi:alpha-tubulin suppressor-like RCC1 family protein
LATTRFGQLGLPGARRPLASTLPRLGNVLQVAAGGTRTCALLGNLSVRCWGDNGGGRLGVGSPDDAVAPRAVVRLAGAAQIGLGYRHNCARLTDGGVRCWGDNARGQLGDGTVRGRPTPHAASQLESPISASVRVDCAAWTTFSIRSRSRGTTRRLDNGE